MYYVAVYLGDILTHRASATVRIEGTLVTPEHRTFHLPSRRIARLYAKKRNESEARLTKDESGRWRFVVKSDSPAKPRVVTPKEFVVYQRNPHSHDRSLQVWHTNKVLPKRQAARDHVKAEQELDAARNITGWQYKITERKLAQGQG